MEFSMKTRTLLALFLAVVFAGALHVILDAQGQVGQNINIVSGSDDQFIGDMFRQRQNEGVLGISSVNPSHMMAAYNDYRTVDFAFDQGVGTPSPAQSFVAKLWNFLRAPWKRERERDAEGEAEEADAAQAWIGLSFTDNGVDWYTGLLPGHPFDTTSGSPLSGLEAASDPVLATTHNQFFLGGIAFNPGGSSVGFVSRFTDRNNTSTGQNIQFDWTKPLLTQPARFFVDKPSIAAGPNGHVYAAFVVFDQLDPKKLSSNIVFFRSADYGETWSSGTVISQPLTRNQSPWILIDPNNENIVYVGWRLFSYPALPNLTNAIVGKKSTNGGQSFSPSVPYPVALVLKAFDAPQVPLSPTSPQIPRSNAYPTATIDGNGAIHVAMQEYVYPANYPTAVLRGIPLGPNTSTLTGVPRITVTSSYDGGTSWTLRRAVDLGAGAGTQFMPVLAAVGEPGDSCPGRSGPKSRVMVMYYDARAGLTGVTPGSNGGVAGGDKQFDVRIAQASACIRDGLGNLVFSPSEQLSRYSLSSVPPHDIVKNAGFGVTSVNRAYSMFCGGLCAFTGDYVHLIPRVPYVLTGTGWKPTTASSVDKARLPAPLVQGVWADTRDAVLPTTQPLRPGVPPSSPLTTPPYNSTIDSLRWDVYQPPGTGLPPTAVCDNAGSRDQNVYTALYAPGQLFAAAPDTFRPSNIPHAYPLYVENRSGQQRFFRLTLDAASFTSFNYRSFDTTSPLFGQLDKDADIAIGPYSTVTGSVVVGAGFNGTVTVTIEQLASSIVGGNIVSTGTLLAGGAKTAVTLQPAPATAANTTENHEPVVAPTPEITFPFAGRLPIIIPAGTLFNQTPFSQTTSEQNPFSQTPFSQTPFSQTVTIYEVTDINFKVTQEGNEAAAFGALLAVQNALSLQGSYLFQVIIDHTSTKPALNGCNAVDRSFEVQISNIVTPFSQTPFSQTPFSQTPFSQTPFSQTPFSQTPFSQTPFSQTSDPRDPTISNSTFYIAPPGTPTPSYRADRPLHRVDYRLRAYQIRQANDAAFRSLFVNGQPQVAVTVRSDTPEVVIRNGQAVFDPAGPTTSTGGAAAAVQLAFIVQPTSTAFGQVITPPVRVAVQDGFGNQISTGTYSVTLALGSNPGGGILSGTLTRNTVEGVATFPGLSINNIGVGYTLTALAAGLNSATSAPFDITRRLAIVTNSNEGTISVIDFVTDQAIATLQTAGFLTGATVTANGALGIVADFGAGRLYRVNLASAAPAVEATTIATVPFEGPGIQHPESTAITRNGRYAVVGDGAPQSDPNGIAETDVIAIDLLTNTIVSTVSGLPGNQGVAFTPDENTVLVLSADTRQVAYLSFTNGVLADTGLRTTLPGNLSQGPRVIAVTPDGALALVTDMQNNLVNVVRLSTRQVVQTVTGLGSGTSGLAITPSGTKAYVSSAFDSKLWVLNVNPAAALPVTLATPTGITVPNGTPQTFYGVPGLALTPDGGRLFIAGFRSNQPGQISILDTATDTLLATTIPVGVGPVGLAMPKR